LAQKKFARSGELKGTLAYPEPVQDESIEIDELWSFVKSKKNKAWVWIAISFQTRQILAIAIGDRSAKTCLRLWQRLPEAYKHLMVYTDFWEAYQAVIPQEQHEPCGKGSGHTNTVERFNLTLRQRCARFVRKTLSFSKSRRWHWIVLKLFVIDYNHYCKKRFKLRTI
jgi:insertion element IS1 protein InsB